VQLLKSYRDENLNLLDPVFNSVNRVKAVWSLSFNYSNISWLCDI